MKIGQDFLDIRYSDYRTFGVWPCTQDQSTTISVRCIGGTAKEAHRQPFLYGVMEPGTECPKMYRKSVLSLFKYRFAVHLRRCSTDLR